MTDKPKPIPLLEPAPDREDLNQKLADAALARESHRRLGRGLRGLMADQDGAQRHATDRLAYGATQTGRTLTRTIAERELRSIQHQLDRLIETTTDAELSGEELETFADGIRRQAWARQRKGV